MKAEASKPDVRCPKGKVWHQVEQNLPTSSLQMQKTSEINFFKSHERMPQELTKK